MNTFWVRLKHMNTFWGRLKHMNKFWGRPISKYNVIAIPLVEYIAGNITST